MFRNKIRFYGEELLAPCPTHKLRTTPVGCPRLLIRYIQSYSPYWRVAANISNNNMQPEGSGVPRNFVQKGFNKFSWGQRTERTGIWGAVAP